MTEKLTPFIYSEGPKYRFTLESDFHIRFTDRFFGLHSFHDGDGVLRMTMDQRTIHVPKGYSWDGSSPKIRVFGRWIGTPDFEATRMASMIHDTLYQFLHAPCFPLVRQDCDRIFGEIMKSQGFPLWWIYSGAVLHFGGIHYGTGSLFGRKRTGTCAVKI